jgi:hypothetical protein
MHVAMYVAISSEVHAATWLPGGCNGWLFVNYRNQTAVKTGGCL